MMSESKVVDEEMEALPPENCWCTFCSFKTNKKKPATIILMCTRNITEVRSQWNPFQRFPMRSRHWQRCIKMLSFSSGWNSPKCLLPYKGKILCQNKIGMSYRWSRQLEATRQTRYSIILYSLHHDHTNTKKHSKRRVQYYHAVQK